MSLNCAFIDSDRDAPEMTRKRKNGLLIVGLLAASQCRSLSRFCQLTATNEAKIEFSGSMRNQRREHVVSDTPLFRNCHHTFSSLWRCDV